MLLLFWGLKKQGRKLEAGGLAGVRPFSHRHLFQVVALGSGMSRERLSFPPLLCVTAQEGLGSWWSNVSSLVNLCFETLLSCICGAGLQSEAIPPCKLPETEAAVTPAHTKWMGLEYKMGEQQHVHQLNKPDKLHARTWWKPFGCYHVPHIKVNFSSPTRLVFWATLLLIPLQFWIDCFIWQDVTAHSLWCLVPYLKEFISVWWLIIYAITYLGLHLRNNLERNCSF